MSVTERDRERARAVMAQAPTLRNADAIAGVIAAAIAAERERALAPFLAYADECAAIGDDRSASVVQRSINRAVAEAFRRAAARDQPC